MAARPWDSYCWFDMYSAPAGQSVKMHEGGYQLQVATVVVSLPARRNTGAASHNLKSKHIKG